MLDSYNTENMRDFGARYGNTYAWLTHGGVKRLVKILETSPDRVYFITEDNGMHFHANRDAGIQFEFTQVDHGFFVGADDAVYLMSRRAARQWKRGICGNNTSLMLLTGGGFMEPKLGLKILNNVFHPTNRLFQHDEPKPTMALSKHFALSDKRLFFYDNQIGQLDRNNITINSNVNLGQEVQDALDRCGANKFYRIVE